MERNVLVYNCICLFVAIVVTVSCILTGAHINRGYDIQVGDVSPRRFRATTEVINPIATQRRIDEAIERSGQKYTRDPEITSRVLRNLQTIFDEMFQLRREKNPIYTPYDEGTTASSSLGVTEANLTIPIPTDRFEQLLTMRDQEFVRLRDDITDIVTALLQTGINENLDAANYSLLATEELARYDLEREMHSLYLTIIFLVIEPNIVPDPDATARAIEGAIAAVEPVKYLKDQNIVDEGGLITEEIHAVLEVLGFTDTGLTSNYFAITGSIMIVLSIFFLCALYMWLYHKDILNNRKWMALLYVLVLSTILAARLSINIPHQFVPILVFTLLVAILLNIRLAIVLNLGVTLVCSLIIGGEISFIIFGLVSGTIVALFSRYTTERSKIVIVGLIASVVNALIYVGVTFLIQKNYSPDLLDNIMYCIASGTFSVIITVGSLPIWEAVFGIVTPIRLLDLTNPTSPLIRRLTIEAPGTYHHSLIVANLAETAAYDVSANPILARVGGYYHDIGKLKEPQYFSENQTGQNLHDFLEPMQSVDIIKRHVAHGMELADYYRLPKVVKDILTQHHGTTMIKFFYYKAKKGSPDAPLDEKEFRYSFGVPKSKEAAIVMIADTAEAAVRSMIPSGKSMEEVEAFVLSLIKDKLDDGQLNESGLSIKDLIVIRKSFMRVFHGMYHERIPYPKGEEKEASESKSEEKEKVSLVKRVAKTKKL